MEEFLIPIIGAAIGIVIGELLWYLILEPIIIKFIKRVGEWRKKTIV